MRQENHEAPALIRPHRSRRLLAQAQGEGIEPVMTRGRISGKSARCRRRPHRDRPVRWS